MMKIIGLDIGGTSIKGAVLDGTDILCRKKVSTNASKGRDAVLESIFKIISLLEPYADESSPIGIGSAGDIDPVNGKVVFATGNLPNFTGLELGKIVEEETGRKTSVVNDASAGLIGEMYYGAGEGKKNIVMLTLGTGLGGGIAVDGKVLSGKNFRAGRIGHIMLHSENPRKCNCGRVGCAEQYVSATALSRNAEETGVSTTDCTEIFRLALEGDEKAFKASEIFLNDLARVIDICFCIFDPEKVIIGGGLAESREYWWHRLTEKLEEGMREFVVPAKLGNNAGFFGSQRITWDKSML